MELANCQMCGKEFKKKTPANKTCSPECSRKRMCSSAARSPLYADDSTAAFGNRFLQMPVRGRA